MVPETFNLADLSNEQKAAYEMHCDAVKLREDEISSFDARSRAIALAAKCIALAACSLFIYTLSLFFV